MLSNKFRPPGMIKKTLLFLKARKYLKQGTLESMKKLVQLSLDNCQNQGQMDVIRLLCYRILHENAINIMEPGTIIEGGLSLIYFTFLHLESIIYVTTHLEKVPIELKSILRMLDDFYPIKNPNLISHSEIGSVFTLLKRKKLFDELVTSKYVNPLRIIILPYCDKNNNSSYSTSINMIICSHIRREVETPIGAFLHELGHALHLALTGSVEKLPDSFLSFMYPNQRKEEIDVFSAAEIFAETVAIGLTYKTEFEKYMLGIEKIPNRFREEVAQYIKCF